MAYFGKVFKFEKAENYDAFVESLGLPADQAAQLKAEHSLKLVKNGDSYTESIIHPRGTRDITFKSGEEFDERIRADVQAKSTITVSGDKLVKVQKFGNDRVFTFIKEYSDSKLKETITTNFWNGSATLYFTA